MQFAINRAAVTRRAQRHSNEPISSALAHYCTTSAGIRPARRTDMKPALVFALIGALTMPALAQTPAASLRETAAREATHLATATDTASSQAAPVQQRHFASRHSALTGTLIGLGVGFGIGAVTCKYPGSEGSCDYYTFPGHARMAGGVTIGLVGAGIGAAVGALIGAVR
jgi:ferric-dicitrate binding protein FerR (iron transport regulator)